MREETKTRTIPIPTGFVAPCGMNCRLCWGYMRENNRCPGCLRNDDEGSQKSKCRNTCKIKNCEYLAKGRGKYCSARCDRFPCARLKSLDRRYKTRYGMSPIDNLRMIGESGVRIFVRHEKERRACPECGELICVHKPTCLACDYKWR